MKQNYTLVQRLTAYMLLMSLFLQSCHSPSFLGGPSKQVLTDHKLPKGSLYSYDSYVEETHKETKELIKLENSRTLELDSSDFSKSLLISEIEVKEGPIEVELILSKKETSQVNHREGRSKREVSRIAFEPIKTSRTQLNSSKAIQESTKRKPALLKNQQPFSENQQISKDQFRTTPTRAELAVREATKRAKPLSSIRKGIIPVTSSILETDNKAYTTKGGHQVRFQKLASGEWKAVVEECLPAGISRRLLLPVYILPGYSIASLHEHSPSWQKNHIHVVSQQEKSFVYIGTWGLLGGMIAGNDPYAQKPVDPYAPYMNEGSFSVSLSEETAFTSEKGIEYQFIKEITLPVAQEVQVQTGLVIPFAPGKTTTSFLGGKGNFGELRLGKATLTGKYVGIKVIKFEPEGEEKLEKVRGEARLQASLNGLAHLMPILDAGETIVEDSYMMRYQVMPLASLGNGVELASYLRTLKDHAFEEAILIHVAKGILEGFAAFHSLKNPSLAHLDFKPANLVIDQSGEVYIIDFGCAAALDEKGYLRGYHLGDRNYFSLEREKCLDETSIFAGQEADNYAIGCTLEELCGRYVFEEDQPVPGSYESVVQGFLERDPSKRLTAQEALKLPLFQQDTRPEVLSFLKEFVQTLQWDKRKGKEGQQTQCLTSVQQLPLPHFTGYAARPDLEQAVTRQLQGKASLVACTGMGGVGKTQLLTYLVHSEALQQGYKHIYWFQASDKESSLLAQYHGLAQALKLVDEKTPVEEAKAALLAFLEKQSQATLLVFDNADEPVVLKSFLPKPGGACQVVVSSRSPNWDHKIALEVFGPSEVRELLGKLLPDKNITIEEVKLLGELMGYLPLALNQAIALIRQENTSIKDYVTAYQSKHQAILKANTQLYGKSLPNSMDTLYQMQLAKLGQECPEAIKLLEYSAFLAPDNIPLSLLSKGLLGEKVSDKVYKKAEQALLAYALWQKDKEQGNIRIHRLMQEVVRLPISDEAINGLLSCLLKVLDKQMPTVTEVPDKNWKDGSKYASHVEKVVGLGEKTLGREVVLASLLDRMGSYYKEVLCSYQEGLSYYKRGLDMYKRCHVGEHAELATSLNNVGNAYVSLGEIAEGLQYQKQALEMRKALYPGNHPDIGMSLNNVGSAYYGLGEIAEGLQYQKQALEMQKALYQGNHPDIAMSLNNVGTAYQALGQIAEGLKYKKQALEMRKVLYQGNHPDIGISLNNVGNAYYGLGEIAEGLQYQKQALEMQKALYPGNHPSIAMSLNNVGSAYASLGQIAEGLEYFQQALEMQKALYPGNHPSIAMSLNNVGRAYHVLGRKQEALKYYEQALEIYQATLPANHTSIQMVKGTIAMLQEE